jgi:hypothetical protein
LALAGLSKSVTATPAVAMVQPKGGDAQFAASTYTNTKLTYKLITASQSTWGYDVFADDRLIIHQSSVPARPGNEGFKTKDDASKVALLVIEKVRKGEMPPTIFIEEMKQLKVIK